MFFNLNFYTKNILLCLKIKNTNVYKKKIYFDFFLNRKSLIDKKCNLSKILFKSGIFYDPYL